MRGLIFYFFPLWGSVWPEYLYHLCTRFAWVLTQNPDFHLLYFAMTKMKGDGESRTVIWRYLNHVLSLVFVLRLFEVMLLFHMESLLYNSKIYSFRLRISPVCPRLNICPKYSMFTRWRMSEDFNWGHFPISDLQYLPNIIQPS